MSINWKSRKAGAAWHCAAALTGGALAIAFGVLLTANVAAAATCAVGSTETYTTIQAAVADTSCTTINVDAGNYTGTVTIDRTLTLNGANAGIDARDTDSRLPESTITGNPAITITAPNVVVDGFTITNVGITAAGGYGIDVDADAAGAVIANNIFDGITGSSSTAQAIDLVHGPDGAVIVHNVIENVSSPKSAKGVFIGDSHSTDPSNGVVVAGNEINNVMSTDKGAYGVTINNGNGNTKNYGLVIENNDINDLSSGSGWVHAVGIEADAPDAIVDGNSFSDLTAPGPDVVAVWFEGEDASYAASKVNGNNFLFGKNTSVYGIAVDPSLSGGGEVDGAYNYWGDRRGPGAVGPGSGALVTPLVEYAPWLKAPAQSADH